MPQVTIGAYQFRSDTVSGYAPAEVTFTLSSGSQFEDARLLDMDGRVVDSYVFRSEQDDGSVQWSLIATFENAYFGPVTAQLLAEGVWQDTGEEIPIEMRDKDEVTEMWYKERMAPEGVDVFNPAFDVSDHSLFTGIITEKGLCHAPYKEAFEVLGIHS